MLLLFSLNFLARFFETTSSPYHHFSIDSSVSDSYEILHRDLHENGYFLNTIYNRLILVTQRSEEG